jgi:two-component system response regulator PilR (NtrC family)
MALDESGNLDADDLYLPRTEIHPETRPRPDEQQPLEDFLGAVEKQAILKALEATRWNRTAAAKMLGMSLRSLRYRLSKLGIE